MGGFYGDVKEELFIRWSQFGLFSSHSRLHGTITRQPWAYGDKACAILANFIRLRYKLMPYVLKTAASCVKNGAPFIRPLVMENSDDPSVFGIWDVYHNLSDRIHAYPCKKRCKYLFEFAANIIYLMGEPL
jgi:alpha-D-xyloside xylohydrolase